MVVTLLLLPSPNWLSGGVLVENCGCQSSLDETASKRVSYPSQEPERSQAALSSCKQSRSSGCCCRGDDAKTGGCHEDVSAPAIRCCAEASCSEAVQRSCCSQKETSYGCQMAERISKVKTKDSPSGVASLSDAAVCGCGDQCRCGVEQQQDSEPTFPLTTLPQMEWQIWLSVLCQPSAPLFQQTDCDLCPRFDSVAELAVSGRTLCAKLSRFRN